MRSSLLPLVGHRGWHTLVCPFSEVKLLAAWAESAHSGCISECWQRLRLPLCCDRLSTHGQSRHAPTLSPLALSPSTLLRTDVLTGKRQECRFLSTAVAEHRWAPAHSQDVAMRRFFVQDSFLGRGHYGSRSDIPRRWHVATEHAHHSQRGRSRGF